jgi:hypothetical protein
MENAMAMIKCKSCGKHHSDNMPACPFCSPSDGLSPPIRRTVAAKTTSPTKKYIAVFLCILFVGAQIYSYLALNRIEGGAKKQASRSQTITPSMAYLASQDFVKSRLKAPATADFPYEPGFANPLGGNRFEIGAYVDSQNSFGALLRSHYVCIVVWSPNGQWRLEGLTFLD